MVMAKSLFSGIAPGRVGDQNMSMAKTAAVDSPQAEDALELFATRIKITEVDVQIGLLHLRREEFQRQLEKAEKRAAKNGKR